jgi:hypothetical protein
VFFLLWDASALAQRYAPEIGHQTVNALFALVSRAQMIRQQPSSFLAKQQ